jgi:hypothetical protein
MPLTVEERKEISKAKKLEKYAPRVNGNNASAELDVENEEAADTNTNTEAPQAESSTNLNDLRERLQVSPYFHVTLHTWFSPQSFVPIGSGAHSRDESAAGLQQASEGLQRQ